ncbi:hypothetical protein [Mycobacterium sp. IS-3022]|uniref:hypothetical protein n=1 Tax=Mycobacterium sp. IS-3022 TaxID=1772277 RepID=UPI0007415239|nr:hypothetical protein [Mycobacterium sp. IS-3022]
MAMTGCSGGDDAGADWTTVGELAKSARRLAVPLGSAEPGIDVAAGPPYRYGLTWSRIGKD